VVAIIDDNDLVRDGLESLITSAAYVTECYPSAEEFLDKVATSDASCLVLDIQMNGLSGIELAHRLATLGYTYPIIFMTASNDPRHQQDAAMLGCMAFLQKPADPQELLDFIALAVKRR
jgi:FixJ family two-component response regulator